MIHKMQCIKLTYSLYLHIWKTLGNQFDVWVIEFHHYGDINAWTLQMLYYTFK